MAIKINITKPGGEESTIDSNVGVDIKPSVGINITNSRLKDHVFELTVRETLNGDLMIYDHKDIDIVLMQEKKKIVAFAKDFMSRGSAFHFSCKSGFILSCNGKQ